MSNSTNFHNYRLQELAWPQVEAYLRQGGASARRILVPVGSTEQHGVSGLLGIDYLSAEALAQEVAVRTRTLVAPALPFGMAVHHMAFPGTVTFTPSTYVQVIGEIIQSLARHGFEEMIFVNGHGGNTAPITTAFCEAKMGSERLKLKVINWWTLPEVAAYEREHFGDKSGFHATVGEISATMHTHPEAYEAIGRDHVYHPTPVRSHWPMSPAEFRENFPQGHMSSDPSLATREHGGRIFEIAVKSICAMTASS